MYILHCIICDDIIQQERETRKNSDNAEVIIMSKVVSLERALRMIPDHATICFGGFVGCMHAETLSQGIENHFLHYGFPRDLTLVYAAGQGDGGDRGLNHLGHEGLLKRIIGGHWALTPKLQKLALENKVEAYNFPQGVIAHLMRDIAAGRPGVLTHVGLNTFVDPRLEGGKINKRTRSAEDLVVQMDVDGREYLLYKAFPVDVALVRATYADSDGNATFEHECIQSATVSMCQAAKNSGGKVILQVEGIVPKNALNPRLVRLPGIYVDAIVVAAQENHMQTFGTQYNAGFSGEVRTDKTSVRKMDLDIRKIIARRCAMELEPGVVVNLGIGMPEGVSAVASEEEIGSSIALTVESGVVGGIPASGQDFGASLNYDCMLDEPTQFDFYDGGGLDLAFLGLAQADQRGNVNVSRFGPKVAGCGGFINITQNAKRLVYCGTFTAGGVKIQVRNGRLEILQEGTMKKFLEQVEQITFSGSYAIEKGQPVIYVTERAVFKLTSSGLVLTEVAPGINVEKDILQQMEFMPTISKDLVEMDSRIFEEKPMGLNKPLAPG